MNALEIGVCSWSLQVTCVNELAGLMTNLGLSAVQIACGDPHHAAWSEGDSMPAAALASGLNLTGSMLGFPGEDYTTPASIKNTRGINRDMPGSRGGAAGSMKQSGIWKRDDMSVR